MKREILLTKDGSHTIHIPEMQVTYHSVYGALQESRHVFMEAGFLYTAAQKDTLHVLEIGFGTGLNALLTAIAAKERKIQVAYHTIEPFPIDNSMVLMLTFPGLTDDILNRKYFLQLHESLPGEEIAINVYFRFTKYYEKMQYYKSTTPYDVVYFDAFAPETQPDLWNEDIFRKIYMMMAPGGCLVTYCSKGSVRRAMEAAGFAVTKLQGPPGKREMVRAIRVP